MTTEEILAQIGALADEQGLPVYAVGGFVRDRLRGVDSADIDFVVVGDGPEFARLAKKRLQGTGFVVYDKFCTASFLLDGRKLEFVSARAESYEPHSRKPAVRKATLADDLSRRDFTINAMALSVNRASWMELVDPFGGRQDLEHRVVRTPLDPEVTFQDDPLRIMRAIRFATQLDFRLEKRTKAAIAAMRERLAIVSQERITEELRKILMASRPSIGFRLMGETKVLEVVLPEISALKGVEQIGRHHHKDVFLHTLKVLDNVAAVSESFPLRFAALFHDVAKPQTKAFVPRVGWTFHGHDEIGARMMKGICRRLRLPNETEKYAEKMIRLHLRPIHLADEGVSDSAIRRLIVQAGQHLEELFILCRADITSGNPARVSQHLANFDHLVQRIHEVEEKDRMRAFQSPVRGDEIMAVCGIGPGPMVGRLKKMIEEAILDGQIPNEHDAAYRYLLSIKDEVLASGEPTRKRLP
ncbi:MAG: HD domain-containing protein [bacterium]|nr:CCA tRNA nucleotidyltransferase [candidate division KSB1 bacterium]MDH7559690.1 HD domain-containing protein [bacterium]